MKLNELIPNFFIFTTNEESKMLENMGDKLTDFSSFSEHDQIILNSLVKKDLVKKVFINSNQLVIKNVK